MSVELTPRGEGGIGGRGGVFCSAPHPTNPEAWCRRLGHYPGERHAAFTFLISEPEEWYADIV